MSPSDLRKSGLTRKQVRSFPLRYYLISEYGTKWLRPHFHVILYNLPSVFASSEYLSSVWSHGSVDVGNVTPDSIAYVTAYRIGVPRGDDYHAKYGTRMRPYSCMSKGLGSSYISTVRKMLLSGSLPDTVALNGKLVALPSYYLRKVSLPVVARANRLIDASNRAEQRLISSLSDRYHAHGGSDDRPLYRHHESFLYGAQRLLNAKELSHSHF
ncbi:MAG: putative replication initiation protein [Microviridae sp.]|nr:MAG: putative replication initiation protein [Microviridae sp.]